MESQDKRNVVRYLSVERKTCPMCNALFTERLSLVLHLYSHRTKLVMFSSVDNNCVLNIDRNLLQQQEAISCICTSCSTVIPCKFHETYPVKSWIRRLVAPIIEWWTKK